MSLSDQRAPVRAIRKFVAAIDDRLTGGGIGGFLRGIYLYLFGLKSLAPPRARMAKELDFIANTIHDQSLTVHPEIIDKLARIADHCAESGPENSDICISALHAIETAMEWPVRDLKSRKIIAKLQNIARTCENTGNVTVADCARRASRAVENRPV